MKSRYSAYAVGESDYIIKTTHPNNPDFTEDRLSWRRDIEHFSSTTQFLKLEILDFIEGEHEAFVTFIATLSGGELREKSRFLKINNQWFYESMV
jgi:SEC-C motif-containing protein